MARAGIAKWLGPPRSYTRGRRRGQPRVIVIHTTEGSEGVRSAEDGAAYDKRRTDGTSTHFFVDQDSIVQCVDTGDEAHAARSRGNDIGIHIEVCGKASQNTAQWHDNASTGTLANLVKLCRELVRIHHIDPRHLTIAEVRGIHPDFGNFSKTGFCSHRDITSAFPEDAGDHTDPGISFPWAEVMQAIREDDVALTPDELAILNEIRRLANNADRYGWLAVTQLSDKITGIKAPGDKEVTITNNFAKRISAVEQKLDVVTQAAQRILSADSVGGQFTDAQVDSLANRISQAIVDHPQIPLGQAEVDALLTQMKGIVKQALREGTNE